ncbi:MAG TPA: TetR/AcrR family transcriptional regulator [Steroidobacteraceae bacterium]|nr:TetR/AcrR family transcriptional regulator [Steroidobacteraceae bacterium]
MKSAAASRRHKTRRVGRPDSQADTNVREALLNAARELFLERGFERTTARQIAQAARTTPAMIHYYFGDKAGLFEAMLDQTIAPLRALLIEGASAGPLDPTTMLVMQMRVIAANAWIPAVVVNEVLAQPGRLRPMFVRDVAGRHMPLLVKLFEQGKRAGRVRRDLDPKLAALSFISLCVFPFVARAVVEPVFGIRVDEQIDEIVKHTERLLMRGIAASEQP